VGYGSQGLYKDFFRMTFAELRSEILNIIMLKDPIYLNMVLDNRINGIVSMIAAGINMPDRSISPPLSDLYSFETVATTTEAYASLPDTYQRNVFSVIDSSSDQILPPHGGNYYSFQLFLRNALKKDLTQIGEILNVAIKGSRLYYQGIPAAASDLTVHFYRKPVDMSDDADTPDGIPEHLQSRLIRNYVAKDLLGEAKEKTDQTISQISYHETEFYNAMQDLIDYIGTDSEPIYYGRSYINEDYGICD